MEPVYTPVLWTARSLFAFQGLKFDTTGQENIPRTGGGVVALNHFGYMDFALSGRIYLDVDRIVRFMAKKEVFDNKVAGPLMRGMKHIPVDRSAGADAYRAAVDALKAGELVGVFPEATISRSFEIKEIKMRPNIDDHDYDVKMRKVFEFLEEGDKVKVKLLGFDDRGKVRLSMKVVDQETGKEKTEESAAAE